jgi:hypothetical protein
MRVLKLSDDKEALGAGFEDLTRMLQGDATEMLKVS